MLPATVARLKALRSSLETEINSLQSQRAALQAKIENGTASHVELQQDELLVDQIATKTWDLLCVLNELAGLV